MKRSGLVLLGGALLVAAFAWRASRVVSRTDERLVTVTGGMPVAKAPVRARSAPRGSWDRSRDFVEKDSAPKAFPDTAGPSLDEVLGRAGDLVDAGKPDDALSELRAAVARDPGNAELREHLGEFYLDVLKDPAGAVSELERAYRDEPGNPRTLDRLLEALRANGNVEEAIRRLSALDGTGPGHFETKLALADAYLEGNRASDALGVLRPLRDTRDPQVFDRLADVYRRLGQPAREAAALAEARTLVDGYLEKASLEPAKEEAIRRDQALLSVDQAEALADAGRPAEALEALRRAEHRIDPKVYNRVWRRLAAMSK